MSPAAPEQAAELERLACRYFVDRVFDRAQLLERCRRIYEMDPKDALNPLQEVNDLLLSFQQMNEDHFKITNMIAQRCANRRAGAAPAPAPALRCAVRMRYALACG